MIYNVALAYKHQQEKIKMDINQKLKGGLVFKGYNISQATRYALKYALDINPSFGNYEKWGGDCTNYVSQCLYAGNIPFDNVGEDIRYQWYWYSESKRTPSWTAADSLKFYMENNNINEEGGTNLGLKAAPITLNQLLRGDVVQLVDDKGRAYHSMIVTGYLVKEQRVVDYLVSQHSGYDEDDEGRLKNYPLSQKRGHQIFWSIMGYVINQI